jgi:hypothetical protein
MKKYTYIQDSGHGWLEVPREEITPELAEKISSCSYMNGQNVYLEEDCDMAEFLKEKIEGPLSAETYRPWADENIDDYHIDGSCFVRNLPSFNPVNL